MPYRAILQVEDDEADTILIRSALAKAGALNPVHVASDGQQAIDYLSAKGGYSDRDRYPIPCLILLDLKLPKKSGLEVLDWIRRQPNLRHIVVIVFSSSTLPADVGAAYALGANSYVEKPAAYGKALEMAKLLKGWWLDLNQFSSA